MKDLHNIVVLIDADNTRLSRLELVLREISTHGRIVVKRAYGNWKKVELKNWEDELKRLAIKPEQQFDYVTGKNATDMALVIDAMDLLHQKIYDAFVIVASDSDYTPLSIKLHESGVYVMGIGELRTPESFRNSCDEFVFLENLTAGNGEVQVADATVSSQGSSKGRRGMDALHKLIYTAWESYQDDDGYAYVSAAGDFLRRAKPDFDVRSYGYSKLSTMLEAYPERYAMKRIPGKGTTIIVYRCRGK
ncbi:MAG: NYN domain-containing protein [Clostridia bacterium]|nr:NYN domain-containing protein [Clostridia bacterium]